MSEKTLEHPQLLDRIYSFQRHIYDFTRRYYLFGRDTLIRELSFPADAKVLEVGCGTARNLIQIAQKVPHVELYGVDASTQMLEYAEKRVSDAHLGERIHLGFALAEKFSPQEVFGVDMQYDRILFPYSLSMMPHWQEAIDRMFALLPPDGEIGIVDFWDQAGYPQWFQVFLHWWLDLFHVHFKPELLEFLQAGEKQGKWKLIIRSIGKRYAYLARISPL